MDDFALLHRYAGDGSQDAFRQLVDRHLGLVYAAAKRQVGSPDLAKDIAQAVFLELARQAAGLRSGPTLGPWLYVVTRRKAIDLMRREGYRHDREKAAAEAAGLAAPASDWSQIEPLLEDAMETLSDEDRQAVVLRYLEGRSLSQVGDVLGVSDDAAQKRISRALERLRQGLVRRGVAATAAGLAAEISAHASTPVPTGLAASISAAVGAASVATVSAPVIAMTLLQKSLIATVLVGAAAGIVFKQHQTIAGQERTIGALQSQVDGLRNQVRQASRAMRSASEAETAAAAPSSASSSLSQKLTELEKHIADLKQRLANDPKAAIPEIALLSDEEWIAIAAHFPALDSDTDYRKAMAGVRLQSESDFTRSLQKAMQSYLQSSQNRYPTDLSQLSQYFEPPVDPAILQRYQMLNPGGTADPTARGDFFAGLKPSAIPDPAYDTGIEVATKGIRTQTSNGYATDLAMREYKAANNGQPPQDASQLAPYLAQPDLAKLMQGRPPENRQMQLQMLPPGP